MEAAKIRKIIDECLKTEAFRPDMHIVLTILKKPLNEMDVSGQKGRYVASGTSQRFLSNCWNAPT